MNYWSSLIPFLSLVGVLQPPLQLHQLVAGLEQRTLRPLAGESASAFCIDVIENPVGMVLARWGSITYR